MAVVVFKFESIGGVVFETATPRLSHLDGVDEHLCYQAEW